MAIKISGSTIIDDSRVILNSDKIGIGITSPVRDLDILSNVALVSDFPSAGIGISANTTLTSNTPKAFQVFNNSSTTQVAISYTGRIDANEYFGIFKGTIDSGVAVNNANKLKVTTSSTNSNFTLPFVDSTATTGSYQDFLIDSDVTTALRFNPSTGLFQINGTGSNLLTIRTTNNTSDRGIAFQNSNNDYVAVINAEDQGSNTADLVFHVDDSTNTDPTLVEERLRITSDGKIGIGGETSPSNALTIAADSAQSIIELKRTNTNTTGSFGAISWTAMDGHSVANMYALGDGDNEGAHIVFRTTSAAAANDPYNAATVERVRIASDGKVKIGHVDNSNPTEPLHVVATAVNQDIARFTGANKDRGLVISTAVSGSTNDSVIKYDAVSTNSVGQHVFLTDGSEALRINSSGQLVMTNAATQTFSEFSTTNNSTRGIISVAGKDASGNAVTVKIGGFGDTSRGEIFTYSNHDLGFATNNAAAQMILDTDGRLLIGTSTAGHSSADDLTINNTGNGGITIRTGTGSNGAIFFADSTTGDARFDGFVQYNHGTNPYMIFGTATDERLRITSGGQIGIQKTPKEWNTNYRSLQIHDAGYIAGSTDDSFVAVGANNYLDTGGSYDYTNSDYASQFYQVDGEFVFRSAGSGTADNAITWSEKLRILNDGNVVPGVDGSQNLGASNKRWNILYANDIDISGDISLSGDINADDLYVSGIGTFANDIHVADAIKHLGDTDTKIVFTDNQIDLQTGGSSRLYASNSALYVQSGFPLAFLASTGPSPNIKSGGTNNQDLLFTSGTSNPTRLQIKSDGKVGIGTDNPNAHLQVYRETQFASNPIIQARSNNGSTNELKFEIDGDGAAYFNGKVGVGTFNPEAQLDVNVGSSVTAFNIEGSEGQLFSVTNNLTTGSIFAVNDISGTPSINVDADGTIQLAPFLASDKIGIGTTNPTNKLDVIGDVFVSSKVGIGTTNPTSTLHIHDTDPVIHLIRNFASGTSDIGRINFGNSNWDSSLVSIAAVGDGANDAGALVFETQATGNVVTERLRIQSDGKIGIGTDGPDAELHVMGQIKVDDSNYARVEYARNDTNLWSVGLRDTDDFFFFRESGSANVIFQHGNVGINRTDPDQRLNVNGNIEVNAYDSANGQNGYYTAKGLIIGNAYDAGKTGLTDDRNAIIWQERGLDLDFATNDTFRMKLTYDGKVGINSSVPSEQLDVVGNIKASGTITASSFVGPITGSASQISVTDETTDTTCFPVFVETAATTNQEPHTSTSFEYNSSSKVLISQIFQASDGNSPNVASRDKYRLWNSNAYAIGFDNGMSFGGLNDYATTFQMNNDIDRGWVFLDNAHTDAQGAMSLTTQGKMTLAHSLRLGYGESDTTTPGASHRLDVSGSAIVSGNVGIGTDNPNNPLTIHGSGNHIYLKDTATNNILQIRHAGGVAEFNSFDLDGSARRDYVFNQYATEVFRINASGFIGINEPLPVNGLTINKSGDYSHSDGNTYYQPVGKWLSAWGQVNLADSEDHWVGFTGKYGNSSASVNISLAPNFNNTSQQSGMYVAGEATSATSSDFTIGKIVAGSATGQGTSGNVRATKSELFRIKSDGKVGIGTDNPGVILHAYSSTSPMFLLESASYKSYIGTIEAAGNLNNGSLAGDLALRGQSAISFSANNGTATQLRITSTGEVNIGGDYTQTSRKLKVTGDAEVTGTLYANISGSITPTGNVTITGNLQVDGNTTLGDATSDSLTINATPTIINDSGLFVRTLSNAPTNGAQIRFSDQSSASQIGHIRYKHPDASVAPGSNDGFIIGGSETLTIVKVEGRVLVDEKVGIGTNDPGNDILRIHHTGTSTPVTALTIGGKSITTGGGSGIFLKASSDTGNDNRYGTRIHTIRESTNNGASSLVISNEKSDASGLEERLRITSTGQVEINGVDDQDNLVVNGGSSQFAVHQDDTDGEVSLRAQDGSGNNFTKYMTFFTEGGSGPIERLRITQAGQVGINSTIPKATLDIQEASSSFPVLLLGGGGNTNGDFAVNSGEVLQTGHWDRTTSTFTERFRIGTAGALGIAGANYGTSGQVLSSQGSSASPQWIDPSTLGASDKIVEGNTSAEVIDTGSDGRFVVTTEGNEALRIDKDGQVGIGTNDPQGQLHISSGTSGDCELILESDTDNNNENDNSRILFRQDGGGYQSAIGTENNELVLYNGVSGGGIVFKLATSGGYTNATEKIRIASDGVLEIDRGSASGEAIDIKTTATTGASRIRFMESGTSKGELAYSHNNDQLELLAGTGNKIVMFTDGEVTEPQLELDSTGNLNIGVNGSTNPFTYLRFGASLYGAADIRPTDELNHKVGIAFYTDGTQDTTINPTEKLRINSSGHLQPATTDTYDIGTSASNRFRTVYAQTFNGAFTGTADDAKRVETIQRTDNSSHYVTFVDTNNAASTAELIFSNSRLKYNPSTNTLSTRNFFADIEGGTNTNSQQFVAGNTSGSLAMTINDGYGNCNLAFNHRNGTPDIGGSSGRIWCAVDSTTAQMNFELGDNSANGTTRALSDILQLSTTAITPHVNIIPISDGTKNIGSNGTRFATGYFDDLEVTNDANIGGNLTVSGTLTYDDVTNIDAVGIITARAGIDVTGGKVDIQTGVLELSKTGGNNTIEMGKGQTGNHYAYIDMVGDATYTDYGLRLLRGNSGANAESQLTHRGTGNFLISAAEAAAIKIRTNTGATPKGLMIAGTGKVGVNNDSPQQALHVDGFIYLGPNDTNSFVHGGASVTYSADTDIYFVADSNDTSGDAPNGEFIWGGGSNTNTNTNQDFTLTEFGNSGKPRNQYMILDESSLRPASNNGLDLGTTSLKFDNVYATSVIATNISGDITGAASELNITNQNTDTTCFPVFVQAATGTNLTPHANASLKFNASTGALSVPTLFLNDGAGAVEKITGAAGELDLYSDSLIRLYESDNSRLGITFDVNRNATDRDVRMYFIGEDTTYLHSPAVNTLGFTVSGTETLRLQSSSLNLKTDVRYGANDSTLLTSQIYVRGTGLNNSANRQCTINGVDQISGGNNTNRGLHLLIFDADNSLTLDSGTTYDTHAGGATVVANLATAIGNMDRTKIGVLCSYDAFTDDIDDTLRTAVQKVGLFKLAGMFTGTATRHAYAAIFRGTSDDTNAEINDAIEVIQSDDADAPTSTISTFITCKGDGENASITGAYSVSALVAPAGAFETPLLQGNSASNSAATLIIGSGVDLLPGADSNNDIGSNGVRFENGYFDNIFATNITGSVTGTATQLAMTNQSGDSTCFPVFVQASGTGNLTPHSNTSLTFNASTAELGASVLKATGGTVDSGTETDPTNVAIMIEKDDYIYTNDSTNSKRKLIGKTASEIIEIGQTGTALIDEIKMIPGNAGFFSVKTGDTEDRFVVDSNGNIGVNAIPATSGTIFTTVDHFLAIGDNDTGIAQDGDGQFEIWANNQEIVNFNTTQITPTKSFIPSVTNASLNLGSSSNRWGTIYATTIDGTITGTITNASSADQIKTQFITTNADHYISFVDSNNASPGVSETLYTDAGLRFNPSTNILNVASRAVAGNGSGSVAMTINDGYGNANLCFNHEAGVPDVTGSSGRIECGVDGTTAQMMFELWDSVTSGSATGGSSTNIKLRLTSGAVQVYQDLMPDTDSSKDIGSNTVRFANIYGDTLYGDGSNITGITAGGIGGLTNVTVDYTGRSAPCTLPITISTPSTGVRQINIPDNSNAFGAKYVQTSEPTGTSVCDGDVWYDTTSSGGDTGISLVNSVEATYRNITFADDSSASDLKINDNGRLQVRPSDGALRIAGDITAFYSSDARLKKNISPIKNALEKVRSISGNTFEWNEKTHHKGKEVGVIAQEVEKLDLPGVTTTRQDGTKAVRYEKLVPLLIEAIKELKDEINEIRANASVS